MNSLADGSADTEPAFLVAFDEAVRTVPPFSFLFATSMRAT